MALKELKTVVLLLQEHNVEPHYEQLLNETRSRELYNILKTECKLKTLKLTIETNDNLPDEYQVWRNVNLGGEPWRSVPSWIQILLDITELKKLQIYWTYDNDACLGRTLDSLALMRSRMLENGDSFGNEGIRVRLRYVQQLVEGNAHRVNAKSPETRMDLDKFGKSGIKRERRAKATPWCWCALYNRF
ncbi:hypothetical protein K469DRAFT_684772 [Zopfia rhizophila CBS 207.26]|uniref:Uncharacterized protein n=1 Tax=Zopfia rhizophila CBS 207.26 TaxID=1314779 RepID=A0A6A6DA46_9PEZI|nr:hypothetical protein K469DRAFT_684772 [Zopfia rhizophila CBS 207.26]